jgi:hypothetical protein
MGIVVAAGPLNRRFRRVGFRGIVSISLALPPFIVGWWLAPGVAEP